MSWKLIATVYACVVFYFCASISLTVFNKWFFSEKPSANPQSTAGISAGDTYSSHQFHFPLTVTSAHQFIVFMLVLATEKNFLARFVGDISRSRSVALLVVPIGFASGLDWGLSNTSLRWIPLAMYEMVKCSSPLFVLLLSWWWNLQVLTPRLLLILVALSVGIFLSLTGGNISSLSGSDFPVSGFLCVVCATLLAGVRVVLAQRVLHGDSVTAALNTATFLYYVTPSSSAILIIPAYIFEGPEVARYFATHSAHETANVLFLIVVSSVIAYFLSLSEYALTKNTSGLTLCVTGVAKQALVTAIAMIFFHERLGHWNLVGVAITLIGIAWYNWIKYKSFESVREVVEEPDEEEVSELHPMRVDDAAARKLDKYSI